MPQVSVIIPVYNGERYIEEALASVFAQTFRDFEIIVVNDGSTDDTDRCVQKYRGQIQYIVQSNQGQSISRRNALRQSTGELIAFLDADDVWFPTKLEKQVEFATANPEFGIVSTDALYFQNGKTLLHSLTEWYKIPNGNVLRKLLLDNWIPPSAALVRRQCFEKVTTFEVPPPCYGEDWMMWMEIAAHFPFYFIDELLVRRRLHSESVSSNEGEIQFQCLLRNLDLLKERIPQLRDEPALVREAAYRICFHRGVGDLLAVRLPFAREKLGKAVAYKPYAFQVWMLLLASFLPAAVFRSMRTILHAANKILPG